MPTPSATTTAAFNAVGIEPSVLYGFLTNLFGQGISMAIWALEVTYPFLLIAGFFFLCYRAVRHWAGF